MAAILTFKNKELNSFLNARDVSSIANGLIYGTEKISAEDLNIINSEPTFFYSANELVLSLDGAAPSFPTSPPPESFDFFDDLFTAGSPRRIPPDGFRFSTPAKIRVNSLWNIAPDQDPANFDNYIIFDVNADIVSSSGDRIVFKISANDQVQTSNYFRSIATTKPDYGILLIVVEFENAGSGSKFENAYILKYTHAPLFSSTATNLFKDLLRPVAGIPSYINKYTGPGYTAETLFVPSLTASFVYNFYEIEESDFEVYNSRNYKSQKLDDIPKFVKLTWDAPSSLDFDSINKPLVIPSDLGALGATESPSSPSPESTFTPTALSLFGRVVSLPSSAASMAAASSLAARTGDSVPRIGSSPAVDAAEDEVSTPIRPDPSLIPSPADYEETIARRSDYIGYVIEKERLAENGIDFQLLDVITIPGKNHLEYIDTKIAYGEIYRYKIRSIFRFVNNHNLSMYNDSDSILTKNQTVDYVDINYAIRTSRTFYYDSPDSEAVSISVEESVRPDPPSGVKLFAKSKENKIFITWNQKNQNRDVVGFNVYRRRLTEERFLKLNQELIGVRDNFYNDFDLIKDVDYVYAIEAVDVHGNFSKLSNQFYIRVKEIINFDGSFCEEKSFFLFEEGRELGDILPKKTRDDLILVKNKLKININPLFVNTDENDTFLLKITSLETGIEKFIKLNFKTQTIYHVAPYIPAPRNIWDITEFADSTEDSREDLRRLLETRTRLGF